ncbi:hypothetical protein RCL1_006492 [Eukaryota sp. TZLM3-RCL]
MSISLELSSKLSDTSFVSNAISQILESDDITKAHTVLSWLLEELPKLDTNRQLIYCQKVIPILLEHKQHFIKYICTLGQIGATLSYEGGDFSSAISFLKQIPLDAVQDPKQKAFIVLSLAQLHLEDQDSGVCETLLKKWSSTILGTRDRDLIIKYTGCIARVYDANRNFLAASRSYIQLAKLDPSCSKEAVHSAIITTLLAPAGPQRNSFVSLLYQNEESKHSHLHVLLEKAKRQFIFDASDVDFLKSFLQPHHLATGSDGQTILDGAYRQHNMFVLSKIYTTVKISKLMNILNVDSEEKVLQIVETMIVEKRIEGSIDDFSGTLHLNNHDSQKRLNSTFERVKNCTELISKAQ